MKAVILGSSGMVGSGVLLECMEDKDITEILLVNRSASGIKNPKVKEILHKDFNDFSSLKETLKGYTTCFFCLGISSVGLDEVAYTKITYDITLAFAKPFLAANPHSIFCYISGKGADNSGQMWARVKKKTEDALLELPFRSAYMFRPGYIQPLKGIKSRTGWYNAFYTVFKPLYFLFRNSKNWATDTESLGKAMISAAKNGFSKRIIESTDIYTLSH